MSEDPKKKKIKKVKTSGVTVVGNGNVINGRRVTVVGNGNVVQRGDCR